MRGFLLAIILNPFFWFTVYFAWTAATIDNDLKVHGVKYDAVVINVSRGGHGGVDATLTLDENGRQQILVERSVLLTTKVGDKVSVIALPSDLTVREMLGSGAGNKQQADSNWAFVFFMLTCISLWLRKRFSANSKIAN